MDPERVESEPCRMGIADAMGGHSADADEYDPIEMMRRQGEWQEMRGALRGRGGSSVVHAEPFVRSDAPLNAIDNRSQQFKCGYSLRKTGWLIARMRSAPKGRKIEFRARSAMSPSVERVH